MIIEYIAVKNGFKMNNLIFFDIDKFLKSIADHIITKEVKIVIKNDSIEISSFRNKNEKIIVKTLFKFVYGVKTDIFSLLYTNGFK
nr:hypothetical protein [Candidatus Gracilibacteria bacterium]